MLDHPTTYQAQLGEVIRIMKPNIMIETGVESGFSSEHFLTSMDAVGKGRLFSCDPAPSGFYEAYPIMHPRFTFIRKKSMDALPELFAQYGPFDMFVHDSDHSWENQTQEYEFAWNHTRSGGVIASDDIGWGTNTVNGTISHDAWRFFCLRHGVDRLRQKLNNAEYFIKP
jgi:predicted O-methyltransferase YrrM